MIVKDEARQIRATLESVKPWIDGWTIVDTGSTDATREIVREVLDGIPGDLHEEPFVDFATTRNRALDLAGTDCAFLLLLNGDDVVHGQAHMCRFLGEEYIRDSMAGAYHVQVREPQSGLVYDSARLVRAAAGWRYVGATHEALVHPSEPPPSIRISGCWIVQDPGPGVDKRARWELDLELLGAAVRKDPGDTRSTFYLAQTHECLGHADVALNYYRRRAFLDGWQEEVYESMFRSGRCADAARRPWREALDLYLDAYAHSPHRAEPLHAIAYHYCEQRNWPLCYLFASRGAAIPYPTDARLFVDASVYEWKLHDLVATSAFYVGEFEAGEQAAHKALTARPEDARLRANLAHYEARKRD